MPSRIEDYALIGDCETAALISRSGSIDWLCWPRFDSGACFAALLGEAENGRWSIAPVNPAEVTRRYIDESLILETRYRNAEGEVSVIDFMPFQEHEPGQRTSDLVRLVVGRRGTVAMQMELVLRFDYGASVPWVQRLDGNRGIAAVAGPDKVVLRSAVQLNGKDKTTVAQFAVKAGATIPFVLTHQPSHLPIVDAIDPEASLERTKKSWKDWAGKCNYEGPWREAVMRSLVTLKGLTYRPTGGIVAAPTTSLPEKLGGMRNWDYRHCWIRDATLTLLSLMHTGYFEEAKDWRTWLLRAVAGSPDQMQIMYGIGGERRLPEMQLDWLPGYEGSLPVRIGNAAAGQLQLDVFGELMDAFFQGRKGDLSPDTTAWRLQIAVLHHLESIWEEPDEGIWETRGGRQHFTFSKVMAWVAFDRAIKTIEEGGASGPLDRWRAIRHKIHDDVCERAVDPIGGHFVQAYGSSALDASLLLLPQVGFLPADDPRIVATVSEIQKRLTVDGLVLRYDHVESEDGLPHDEGVFLACSFWLVDVLVLQEKLGEARELFERLLKLRNDVGLLSEEYDPASQRMVGNFPQAFSHVGLINSALNLSRAHSPARQRAKGD